MEIGYVRSIITTKITNNACLHGKAYWYEVSKRAIETHVSSPPGTPLRH